MKSLQQLLAKQDEEQLQRFAKPWAIANPPSDGWIHHRTVLLQQFDDIIAARFAWEALTQDERMLLNGPRWSGQTQLAGARGAGKEGAGKAANGAF